MPRPCSICLNLDRRQINAALVTGEPYRAIAQRFAVSPDAVFRHRRAHLPLALSRAIEDVEVASSESLLADVQGMRARARAYEAQAASEGDYRAAAVLLREQRALIELQLLAGSVEAPAEPSDVTYEVVWGTPDGTLGTSWFKSPDDESPTAVTKSAPPSTFVPVPT